MKFVSIAFYLKLHIVIVSSRIVETNPVLDSDHKIDTYRLK